MLPLPWAGWKDEVKVSCNLCKHWLYSSLQLGLQSGCIENNWECLFFSDYNIFVHLSVPPVLETVPPTSLTVEEGEGASLSCRATQVLVVIYYWSSPCSFFCSCSCFNSSSRPHHLLRWLGKLLGQKDQYLGDTLSFHFLLGAFLVFSNSYASSCSLERSLEFTPV